MNESIFYNDNDPHAIRWLRSLVAAGHLRPGLVDSRPIQSIGEGSLLGVEVAHFFAGIGGWEYALTLAGWPSDRPVWTGSCPCQPFSAAGKRKGANDERHLWPEFLRLIAECRPPTIFGEQVASRLGREWLAGVRTDLEALGYAVGAADLCAASAGAPHIRQRLFWVAHTKLQRTVGHSSTEARSSNTRPNPVRQLSPTTRTSSNPGRVAHTQPVRAWPGDGQERKTGVGRDRPAINGHAGGVAHDEEGRRREVHPVGGGGSQRGGTEGCERPGNGNHAVRVGKSSGTRLQERAGHHRIQPETVEPFERQAAQCGGDNNHFWADYQLISCTDGKVRRAPVEPAFFPLAHRVPGRVAQLRGLGNAIVPQTAALFVRAFLETETNLIPS